MKAPRKPKPVMQISLCPRRHSAPLSLTITGDTLSFDGTELDLSGIPDGASLPRDAVDCEWFASGIERIDGVLHFALFLPHGPDAPEATRFPVGITIIKDGPVPLPPFNSPEVPA